MRELQDMLERIAAVPEVNIRSLMSDEICDRRRTRPVFDGGAHINDSHCIHRDIEQQVTRSPDAPALLFRGQTLTYRELNRQANRIAHFLIERGVGPETRVGLFTRRHPSLVAALLAVLKAGGAYVPIDPSYPDERVRLLSDRARLTLVLTEPSLVGRLSEVLKPAAFPINDPDLFQRFPEHDPCVRIDPDNLAYVIHTSGSTGVPKGVMVTHRGVAENLRWRQKTWPLVPGDRVLQHYSFGFDPSVWASLWPLTAGAAVVLTPDREHFDASWIVRAMIDDAVTVYGATPTMHGALMDAAEVAHLTTLRLVLSGVH
jgi:myxalamid-type nonribosomal peptide synthetase MxaA